MVILRAFPFSFNILWQYIIVFPVIICGLLGLTFLTVIAGVDVVLLLVAGSYSSYNIYVGFYVVAALSTALLAAIFTLPMLVGMRLGLATRGHKPSVSYWALILPASGYGLLVGAATGLIGLGGLAFYLNSSSLSLADLVVLFENASLDYILHNIITDIPLLAQVSVVCWAIFTAFYTALLVPLASVAIGRDPSGNPHTPFAGFGAGFLPLLILVVVGFGLSEVSIPIAQLVTDLIGFGDEFAGSILLIDLIEKGQIPFHMTTGIWVILGFSLVFWLWTVCLLCAGATLVYLNRYDRHQAEMAERLKVERMAPQEVRALWQDRMQR